MNVFEATQKRLNLIFDEFDNIYISFSGGKDSGVMVNMALDIARSKGKKFTLLYIDLEAMYKKTIEFVEDIFLNNLDIINPQWVCLPMSTTNAVSMYEPMWTFWDSEKKNKWVREMPKHTFVITENNNPYPFFYPKMTFEEFIVDYAKWQGRKSKTACLVGIRSDESLNRWRSVNREDIKRYKGLNYSVEITPNCYNFYPIYDWHVNDIWTYNGKFKKPYNHIYDLMYRAGVPLYKMRVCEPYGDEQKAGLNLFKILEPETWHKVIDRVSGANFGNIYCNTKATGHKEIKLPKGHTWKSYCKFILKTLPKGTRDIYVSKFIKFINYWRKNGSPLTNDTIEKIKKNKAVIVTNNYSNRGKGDKLVVKFSSIPDTITGDNKTDMLSWKRMCMAILKNDITCKSLSFSITKQQIEKRKQIIEKYKSLL
jgi:predicted phosphoadenosine phosphosulfate sulfurtransferase